MNHKIHLKKHHYDLIHHFVRFVDARWYPNYKPSQGAIIAFFKQQSYGPKSLTDEDRELIEPLMNGQAMKELTIKMLWEEMASYWSWNLGWWYPIVHTITMEFKDRHIHKDKIYIKALIKILRNLYNAKFFIDELKKFPGLTKEEKERYINIKSKC